MCGLVTFVLCMPSVVFMDIGTYDLVAPDCDPAELAREIVSTAVDFSLVISEILRRKDKRRLDLITLGC